MNLASLRLASFCSVARSPLACCFVVFILRVKTTQKTKMVYRKIQNLAVHVLGLLTYLAVLGEVRVHHNASPGSSHFDEV